MSYPLAELGSRYDNRLVGLGALSDLLAEPPKPTPWRVCNLVADGSLTIIAGQAGAGKSWLAQALCAGVARGKPVAGLECTLGRALYVDGEMGREMFVARLQATGVTTAEFAYMDAMGLDYSTEADVEHLRQTITTVGAHLVVIDSLRRLTPSKRENDSDDMAPAVGALAKLARDVRAGLVLLHHKGTGEKFSRGSTAIDDQCDALFGLLSDPDDEDAPKRLRCRGGGKMRYAPEPPDVYVRVDPSEGGVAAVEAPVPSEPQVPVRQAVADAIKAAMPAKTKKEVAEKLERDRNDTTFNRAWKDLQDAEDIVKINGVWEMSYPGQALGDSLGTTTPEGVIA